MLVLGIGMGMGIGYELIQKQQKKLARTDRAEGFKKGYEYGLKEGLDSQCNVTIIDNDGRMRIYSNPKGVSHD